MKKFLTTTICAILVTLLALTVAGCSMEGNVKSAFKKAGYEVTAVEAEDCKELNNYVNTYVTNLKKKLEEEKKEKEEKDSKNNSKSDKGSNSKDDDKDDKKKDKDEIKAEDVIKKFKIYTVTNGNRKGAFIKFPSEEALELTLGETKFETDTKHGYINGDCYFLSTCTIDGTAFYKAVNNDALYIFKNA